MTLVGEDDVIGTEKNKTFVKGFVSLMTTTHFLTKFPFVSTHANRVGLHEVSIGVNEKTKFLFRILLNRYHYVSDKNNLAGKVSPG